MLRDRQELATRKMRAEEIRTGARCDDDDMRTREMAAIERDELLRIEASARPALQRRRPTARTKRLRTPLLVQLRMHLPTTFADRLTAALTSTFIAAVVLTMVLR